MKIKQRIYLTEDRRHAVPDGDPKARYLLGIAGADIPDAKLDSIEGARELAESAKKESLSKPPDYTNLLKKRLEKEEAEEKPPVPKATNPPLPGMGKKK